MSSNDGYWEKAKEHEGLLNQTVGRYLRKLSPGLGLSFEDLKSYGWEGLFHAARGFDPSRGTEWSTYAAICIRHALDHAVREWLGSAKKGLPHLPTLVSLEELQDLPDVEERPLDGSVPPTVMNAISQLPKVEQKIIILSFIDGWKDDQIAERLQFRTSTVKRLKRKALSTLRGVLDVP